MVIKVSMLLFETTLNSNFQFMCVGSGLVGVYFTLAHWLIRSLEQANQNAERDNGLDINKRKETRTKPSVS